jgi:starvation-inducible DNA-binding protein
MKTKTVKQDLNEIENNPVGLPSVAAKKVCDRLDSLVASLSVQYHQYLKRHWLVEGPEHRDLHSFFEDNYKEVQEEFDTIAERMTTLGSVPTSGLRAQQALAFLEAEDEGSFPIRDMMKRDLENEQAIIKYLRSTIKLCSDMSDFATETILKQTLIRTEERAHELDHYLARDTIQR